MATNKTLTPTNVTIAIPAMTDKPDASVFSNCVDKEADAINALNSNIRNIVPSTLYRPFSGADKTSSFTYTAEHTGMLYLLFIGTVRTYCGITYNGATIGGVAMATSTDPMATTIMVNVKKGDTIGVNNLTANCYVSQQSALIANGYEPI